MYEKSCFVFALAGCLSAGMLQAQDTIVFPQVAVGDPWTTFITVADPHGFDRPVLIELFDSDGNPMEASFDGGELRSSLTIDLGVFEERVLQLTGPALRAGWARLTTDGPGTLDASIRFVVGDPPVMDAVGVLPTEANFFWSVIVDRTQPGSRVGVAIVNPTGAPLEVELDFFKGPDPVPDVDPEVRTLPPFGHVALFDDEIFPIQEIGFTDIGTILVSADSFFHVLSLRLDGDQLSALPAFKPSFLAEWRSPATGEPEHGGLWHFRFFDRNTFVGTELDEVGEAELFPIRGHLNGSRFILERVFEGPDGSLGMVLYQGLVEFVNNLGVVTGRRLVVLEDGTVAENESFSAEF